MRIFSIEVTTETPIDDSLDLMLGASLHEGAIDHDRTRSWINFGIVKLHPMHEVQWV
jgi:hypothetical protein